LSGEGSGQATGGAGADRGAVLARLFSWLPFGETARRVRPKGLAYRPQPRRVSLLTLKVIAFNILALVVFGAGIFWLQEIRVSLVDERVRALRTQAEVVAAAIARYGVDGEVENEAITALDYNRTDSTLGWLLRPTGMRARVFGPDGKPTHDTRYLLLRNQVQSRELPAPGQVDLTEQIETAIRQGILRLRPGKAVPARNLEDLMTSGESFPEVRKVLGSADFASAERINSDGKLILSVAVPIRRLRFVMGVLLLSTEAGDIDQALASEAAQLAAGAVVGFGVILAASFLMLWHVTGPIRRLSHGAEVVRSGGRALDAIPNLALRRDEIGDLSISLRAMTTALHARMDAIEQFAADVAHEIKNPLTSVSSAIEMLRRTTDEGKRQKLMGVIRDDVSRLNRLISDISDASRLDAELSRAKAQIVDLGALVHAVADMFDDPDVQGAPRIVLDLPAPSPRVRGLDGPLAQVFRNIMENALSFSPAGSEIHVSVRAQDGVAVVIIDDQGPGIPEENLEVIFRRFYTSRPLAHGFGKNSGLGLSISRQIIDVHGGRIHASNIKDGDGHVIGARFTVELPLITQGSS